jgi:hypothetical protein
MGVVSESVVMGKVQKKAVHWGFKMNMFWECSWLLSDFPMVAYTKNGLCYCLTLVGPRAIAVSKI